MKLRLFGVALSAFCLGLVTFWAAFFHAPWLHFLHHHPAFRAVNTADLPWKENSGHRDLVHYFMKPMFSDDETGEYSLLVRYPAGQINPPHVHSVGHGMYVVQGKLVTNHGVFGPGTYVWFPAGEVASHGAGPDEEVVVVFTSHDGMTTDYVQANTAH